MIVYHAVTGRPMHTGQTIVFDEAHRSGVYARVQEKLPAVRSIYADPRTYAVIPDHHTRVALRELALEEIRLSRFAQYPSRLGCLYVSRTEQEAWRWHAYFAQLGRPVFGVARLEVSGPVFAGNACLCFDGSADREENLRLAARYWENAPTGEPPVAELLAAGPIRVLGLLQAPSA